MNNEPVALTQVEIMNALTLGIPLYTHPVKEQEMQAEIDALKAENKKYEKHIAIGYLKELKK